MVLWILLVLLGAGLEMSDSEWREHLGREGYNVLRRKKTEAAYSGAYLDEERAGIYACKGCENPLFSSQDKYSEPGCGWPLFKKTLNPESVVYKEDWSLDFKRYEVLCRQCESHLGHVFNDGPAPKHLRYTINSIALVFIVKNP